MVRHYLETYKKMLVFMQNKKKTERLLNLVLFLSIILLNKDPAFTTFLVKLGFKNYKILI